MTTKAKCNTLAAIGMFGIFCCCFDSLGIALVGMLIAILSFSGVAALDPDWGIEYDSNGNVVE